MPTAAHFCGRAAEQTLLTYEKDAALPPAAATCRPDASHELELLDPGWDFCSIFAQNPDGHAFPVDLE